MLSKLAQGSKTVFSNLEYWVRVPNGFQMLKVFGALLAIGSGVLWYYVVQVPETPAVDLDRWWGIGPKPREEDASVRNFTIDFSDAMIQDLKQRLRNRRPFTKPLEGIQSEYGFNTQYLETTIDYWLNKYDFKKRTQMLNRFAHYKTRVQGLDIHFIRATADSKGNKVKVLPLLMLHGWPSSSKEFDKVIPVLTSQRKGFDFVFEVIAADLPGFGFSEGTTKTCLSPVQIAIIMRNLMQRLGYTSYYIQAGDWGSQVATHMATLFPAEVLGLHTNMPLSSRTVSSVKVLIGSLVPWLIDPHHYQRLYPLSETFNYILRESGYYHIQATKPDTIGVALTDSPSGLAAYIMEKMAMCSNRNQLDTPHGGLEHLSLDDVLDTIMIVWTNNCIVTSMRLYAEGHNRACTEVKTLHNIPTEVPTAALKLLHEVVYQPDWILRDKFPNLVHSTTLDLGGHFAGLQTPSVLAEDVFDAVAAFLRFHEKNKKL